MGIPVHGCWLFLSGNCQRLSALGEMLEGLILQQESLIAINSVGEFLHCQSLNSKRTFAFERTIFLADIVHSSFLGILHDIGLVIVDVNDGAILRILLHIFFRYRDVQIIGVIELQPFQRSHDLIFPDKEWCSLPVTFSRG